MAITMLCTVYSCMKRGDVGPCLCLAFINLVPLIGTCSGFEMLSKSCDQQYTHIMLFRVLLTHRVANTLWGLKAGSSNFIQADQDTTDTVKLKYNSSILLRD